MRENQPPTKISATAMIYRNVPPRDMRTQSLSVPSGNLSDWRWRSWLRRQGCKVWNPGGEPFGFIGATDARKPTAHLDLYACHDLQQCPTTGHAHAISVCSLEKLVGRFASLDEPRLVTSTRNMDLKTPLRPVWAQEFEGWPIDGIDNRFKHLQGKEVERDGPTSDQHPGAQAL